MKLFSFKLSSLSHKYIVAMAGVFLMTFLVVHLSINLLMLTGDRADFDRAVEFLTANPFIKVMEYVLFAGFLIHILMGLVVWLMSRRARPVKYYVSQTSGTSPFSKFMIHSGLIILVFLLLHFYHFFFVNIGLVAIPPHAHSQYDFYSMAVHLFREPLTSLSYLVSFVFLGFHLYHGFQSAFQTFGLNHPRYFKKIKILGAVYSLAISIGFSIIPVYFLFFYN
ncbi:MAG TPA: succinate dehydrogenase cytochrome b subunit [Bacteroidales bacterium]|nr:succinate dehydrogenase cytochrome b subunit [Bacteroidales bacterium]